MAHTVTRALSNAHNTPPSEFRIFRAGRNDTSKGAFTFDATAARSVMAAYERAGVDLPIDLEHQMLDAGPRARADACDARGWFRLELRSGELWAVDVRWTPDGARRLSERTQRYISPAFTSDESGRVLEMINAALVAMPATHGAQPIAASRYGTAGSRSIGARLTHRQAERWEAHCKALKVQPGALLRMLAAGLIARDDDALAELKSVLELPKDAGHGEVLEAVRALLERIGEPAPSEAANEGADPPPAEAMLSRAELDRCARAGVAPADFVQAKRDAVRRAPCKPVVAPAPKITLSASDRQAAKRLGLTPAEALERKRNAVRRA